MAALRRRISGSVGWTLRIIAWRGGAEATASAVPAGSKRHRVAADSTAIVYATEPPRGARLDEPLVKALTGQDPVTARFLHKNFFTYVPTFKLLLVTNHKPRIVGTEHAIWRRVLLTPFTVTIPKDDQDPELATKLHEELPGILAWAVEGCREWQAAGLQPPATVLAATMEYRQDQDRLALWLQTGRYMLDPTSVQGVAFRDLYEDYRHVCDRESEEPMSSRAFGDALTERGCPADRTKLVRLRMGIALRPPAPRAEPARSEVGGHGLLGGIDGSHDWR
jgi:putative DNA primase/helicase